MVAMAVLSIFTRVFSDLTKYHANRKRRTMPRMKVRAGVMGSGFLGVLFQDGGDGGFIDFHPGVFRSDEVPREQEEENDAENESKGGSHGIRIPWSPFSGWWRWRFYRFSPGCFQI